MDSQSVDGARDVSRDSDIPGLMSMLLTPVFKGREKDEAPSGGENWRALLEEGWVWKR